MDTDLLASMLAQLVQGVPKEDCPYVTDEESSRLWDELAADIADNPDLHVDIPGELPAAPGDQAPPEPDDDGPGDQEPDSPIPPDEPPSVLSILTETIHTARRREVFFPMPLERADQPHALHPGDALYDIEDDALDHASLQSANAADRMPVYRVRVHDRDLGPQRQPRSGRYTYFGSPKQDLSLYLQGDADQQVEQGQDGSWAKRPTGPAQP